MERQTSQWVTCVLSSQMGNRAHWRDQSHLLPAACTFWLQSPPAPLFLFPMREEREEGNFSAAAVADFSGLCVQRACVFPPLITVLPTDNLAITSQGGSMELMLKLVVVFFSLLFKLQWVMRQRGRWEGEGEL